MVVTVHLHTLLQRPSPHGPQRQLTLTLPSETELHNLLHHLEISLPLESLLLVVNGRTAQPDRILQEGDEVHLIPALSGG